MDWVCQSLFGILISTWWCVCFVLQPQGLSCFFNLQTDCLRNKPQRHPLKLFILSKLLNTFPSQFYQPRAHVRISDFHGDSEVSGIHINPPACFSTTGYFSNNTLLLHFIACHAIFSGFPTSELSEMTVTSISHFQSRTGMTMTDKSHGLPQSIALPHLSAAPSISSTAPLR